ncbi:MAG: hypothetical protein ACYDDA_05820 [Acidiferrobacteraceae bacterium]
MANPIAVTPAVASANPQAVAIAQQQVAALANLYPSMSTAIQAGKIRWNLADVSNMYETMIGKGAYSESAEPLYDTVTLSPGGANIAAQYTFFTENTTSQGVGNVSNSPGQNALPATMAFLIMKASVQITPSVATAYGYDSITAATATAPTPLSTNVIDAINVFNNASVSFTFLQTKWLEVPLRRLIGGPAVQIMSSLAGTYTAPATVGISVPVLGPVSIEGIPEFKEYMFLAPMQNFTFQLKFPSTYTTPLINPMDVTLTLDGIKYRSV